MNEKKTIPKGIIDAIRNPQKVAALALAGASLSLVTACGPDSSEAPVNPLPTPSQIDTPSAEPTEPSTEPIGNATGAAAIEQAILNWGAYPGGCADYQKPGDTCYAFFAPVAEVPMISYNDCSEEVTLSDGGELIVRPGYADGYRIDELQEGFLEARTQQCLDAIERES